MRGGCSNERKYDRGDTVYAYILREMLLTAPMLLQNNPLAMLINLNNGTE
jgi:hypothetical protein